MTMVYHQEEQQQQAVGITKQRMDDVSNVMNGHVIKNKGMNNNAAGGAAAAADSAVVVFVDLRLLSDAEKRTVFEMEKVYCKFVEKVKQVVDAAGGSMAEADTRKRHSSGIDVGGAGSISSSAGNVVLRVLGETTVLTHLKLVSSDGKWRNNDEVQYLQDTVVRELPQDKYMRRLCNMATSKVCAEARSNTCCNMEAVMTRALREMMCVSIDGNISSGKSTYIARLQKLLESNRLLARYAEWFDSVQFEPDWTDVDGINHLDIYYKNQKEYAFTFQIMAYSKRVQQHRVRARSPGARIRFVERSAVGDRVFPETLHRQEIMSDEEIRVYRDTFSLFQRVLERPATLLAYMRSTPQICHSRRIVRGREEESSIPPQYLVDIHQTHEEFFPSTQDTLASLESNLQVYENGARAVHYTVLDATRDFHTSDETFLDMLADLLHQCTRVF